MTAQISLLQSESIYLDGRDNDSGTGVPDREGTWDTAMFVEEDNIS